MQENALFPTRAILALVKKTEQATMSPQNGLATSELRTTEGNKRNIFQSRHVCTKPSVAATPYRADTPGVGKWQQTNDSLSITEQKRPRK